MKKKYELTDDIWDYCGRTLYRIRSLVNLPLVKIGDFGGWIESEKNLPHTDTAWVSGNAMVFDDAVVYGNARVYGNAMIYENARVYDSARVSGSARIFGDAQVCKRASVSEPVLINQNAMIDDGRCIFWIPSIGEETTFFMCSDGQIHVNNGCFNGTIQEFLESEECRGEPFGEMNRLATEIAKLRIKYYESKWRNNNA